jgi:hypothetical protein
MPGFHHITIDIFSFLVALMPTVEMSICLEPVDITLVAGIFYEVFGSCCIEDVYRESELMFTVAWWGTVSIWATPEIPESLLVCRAAITTDHDKRSLKFFLKFFCQNIKCLFCFRSQATTTPCLVYVCAWDTHEFYWSIWSICKWYRSRYESEEIVICICYLRLESLRNKSFLSLFRLYFFSCCGFSFYRLYYIRCWSSLHSCFTTHAKTPCYKEKDRDTCEDGEKNTRHEDKFLES